MLSENARLIHMYNHSHGCLYRNGLTPPLPPELLATTVLVMEHSSRDHSHSLTDQSSKTTSFSMYSRLLICYISWECLQSIM